MNQTGPKWWVWVAVAVIVIAGYSYFSHQHDKEVAAQREQCFTENVMLGAAINSRQPDAVNDRLGTRDVACGYK